MASKRSKTTKRSRVDRISDLPDLVLIKILSFLPFDSAVRTSTLSKRWRPLCMSLSNLCFDDSYGRKPLTYLDILNMVDRGLDSATPHFISRVNNFLMNRDIDLDIEEFGLNCDGLYDITLVNTWIRKALELQVKCMSLDFCFRGVLYQLIPDMFTYGRFEVLRFKRGILFAVPSNFCFSRLKVLEFIFVRFSSYESVENLLLHCPVLEDLVMESCVYLSGCCLTLCGSALKNLTLKTAERLDTNSKLEIVIDTPALETIKICDSALADIFVEETLLSLRTAHIGVGIERLQLRDSVFWLLDDIFHVQSLTLTDKAVGALDGGPVSDFHDLGRGSEYNFPVFHNLIKLELRVDNWSCWNLLPKILASSPNLQTLSLPWGVDLGDNSADCYCRLWHQPRLVPECVSSNLKTIEFGAFHGTADEMSVVEYLLQNGRALQKILIDCAEPERKPRIRKELLRFGRNFKTCKIKIYLNDNRCILYSNKSSEDA